MTNDAPVELVATDVFLLGSGFSTATSGDMPTVRGLAQPLAEFLARSPEHAQLLERWDPDDSDLEAFLDYLVAAPPFVSEEERVRNRADFMAIARWLRGHIAACQERTMQGTPPDWLPPLLKSWHRARVKVLTLNYDTIVESSVQGLAIPGGSGAIKPTDVLACPIRLAEPKTGTLGGGSTFFTSGLVDHTFALFKLHGSLSWYYPGARGVGQPVFDIEFYGTWSGGMVDLTAKARKLPGTTAYIAPPTFAKDPYFDNELIRSIWEGAAEALNSATHLYVMGYSLPAGDHTMRMLLRTRLPVDTAVTVIDPCLETLDRIKHTLPKRQNVSHIGGEEAIQHFVEQLAAIDPDP